MLKFKIEATPAFSHRASDQISKETRMAGEIADYHTDLLLNNAKKKPSLSERL
tara:strand:- start:14808 stop:14966 length:159 start_codon:yes stop_codon:yes gene_type:complete